MKRKSGIVISVCHCYTNGHSHVYKGFFFMSRRVKLYEGKAKIVYEGPEPGTVIQYFKDDATAFNNKKHEVIAGKGVLNNRISAYLMTKLESIGIPTHFIKSLNMREQLVRRVDIIPIELVVRNIAAGSLSKRLGIDEGQMLPRPVVEYYYKSDDLGDPMINEEHITSFGWAHPLELEEMIAQAMRINDYLNGLFSGIGITLVDFKLEFGRLWGEDELYIILSDEISPDNCRLWDVKTGTKLDKDRFRQDMGGLVEAYEEIAFRLGLIPKAGLISGGGINDQLEASLDEIENVAAKSRKLRAVGNPGKPKKMKDV